MLRGRQAVENVAAVELPSWNKIQGGDEEADPSGAADGIQQ